MYASEYVCVCVEDSLQAPPASDFSCLHQKQAREEEGGLYMPCKKAPQQLCFYYFCFFLLLQSVLIHMLSVGRMLALLLLSVLRGLSSFFHALGLLQLFPTSTCTFPYIDRQRPRTRDIRAELLLLYVVLVLLYLQHIVILYDISWLYILV